MPTFSIDGNSANVAVGDVVPVRPNYPNSSVVDQNDNLILLDINGCFTVQAGPNYRLVRPQQGLFRPFQTSCSLLSLHENRLKELG
jgi:hypothetical protein